MNPTQSQDDIELQNTDNPLKVMQPGERVICQLKRHPFGLFGIYAVLAMVIVAAVLAVVAAPKLFTSMTSQNQAVFALGALIVCAITGLFTYVGVVVYKGNRWIVTSDSITQITQISLFNKQTSQLSMANLEDVTVEQNGIMQTMFGFGRLRAETAGEKSKFVFDFCPRPQEYAKMIIAAHEAYIAEKPGEMHTTNQALTNATGFNQSYAQPQYTQMQPAQPMQQPQPGPGVPMAPTNVQQPQMSSNQDSNNGQ